MRKLLICLICLLSAAMGRTQSVSMPTLPDSVTVYEMFDSLLQTKPEFPGGEEKMYQFIGKNLKYPKEARKKGISGLVVIAFTITDTGKVSTVQLLRNPGGGCGEEGVRLIKSMPPWTPGTVSGLPVNVRYVIPLTFKLQ